MLCSTVVWLSLCGCAATGDGAGHANPSPTDASHREAEAEVRRAHEGKQSSAVEEKEEAEEERMRAGWTKALSSYRAPSCDAAIAKIEALLNGGKGRWHERNQSGALPGDLAALLSQAELWASQSEPVCKDSPRRSRLNALRLLMDAIWQYPTKLSKAELEQRLHALGE